MTGNRDSSAVTAGLLLFQRTRVQLPAPMVVIPTLLADTIGICTLSRANTHMWVHIYTHTPT